MQARLPPLPKTTLCPPIHSLWNAPSLESAGTLKAPIHAPSLILGCRAKAQTNTTTASAPEEKGQRTLRTSSTPARYSSCARLTEPKSVTPGSSIAASERTLSYNSTSLRCPRRNSPLKPPSNLAEALAPRR